MADKIAVTSTEPSPDAGLDPRFGRCACFVVFDESGGHTVLSNDAKDLGNGAGIQAAQKMIDNEVKTVITGNVGPNAFRVLSGAGIKVFLSRPTSVSEALQMYRDGKLLAIGAPSAPGHHG